MFDHKSEREKKKSLEGKHILSICVTDRHAWLNSPKGAAYEVYLRAVRRGRGGGVERKCSELFF